MGFRILAAEPHRKKEHDLHQVWTGRWWFGCEGGHRRQGTGNREQATERQGTSHPSEHRSLAGDPGREQGNEGAGEAPARIPRTMLEARLEEVLAELSADAGAPSSTIRQGHLALLKRWYYRPEARRAGEIFFPDAEGRWPVKAILRGIGRVAAKAFAPATQT